MLSQLNIENIAVIERASIGFGKGLTVLTGETGAGKSIVIDSLSAVLGERTSRELIRTDCEKAQVSALFTDLSPSAVSFVEDLGFEAEDGQLLIQRSLSAEGKGVCRIGGQPATASILRQISRKLVDIHGQHDSQELLQSDRHMVYIDALAENALLYIEYRALYDQAVQIKKELRRLQENEQEKERRADLLEYQIAELEAAKIRPGEREELTVRRNYLRNFAKLLEALERGYAALNSSEEGMDAVSFTEKASVAVEQAAQVDETLSDLFGRLLSVQEELEDIASVLHTRLEDISEQPGELDEIEARLDEIYHLSRKYGEDEREMLEYLDKIRLELDQIQNVEEHSKRLEESLQQVLLKAKAASERLTESRIKAGKAFEQHVCKELAYLDMPSVRFTVNREQTPLTVMGADRIEFLISANPGEPPKPIAKIASGGELSRIMLAIKNVLSDKDTVGTMIFDEIDAGISGRAAQKVGRKLHETAKGKQVICVTHLAQIAAQADHQMLIQKTVRNGRTYTDVNLLDFEGRKRELARIVGGDPITDITLKAAEEMLSLAMQEE